MGPKRPNRWNEGRRAILRKRWLEGAMVKAIARETEMAPASVKEERARMGLPPRRADQVKAHALTVYFDDELWTTMQRAAFGRCASMPNYIRALVMRDCGRPKTAGPARGTSARVARDSDDHRKAACGPSSGPP